VLQENRRRDFSLRSGGNRFSALSPSEDQMAQLVVMYKTPQDAAAFDKHYFEKHVPLAKGMA
jgi:hypothetical protein